MLWRARLWAPISLGRRRTLEVQVLKSWQAQYFVHLGLRLRRRGSIWEVRSRLMLSGLAPFGVNSALRDAHTDELLVLLIKDPMVLLLRPNDFRSC